MAGGLAGWALARATAADRLAIAEAPAAPLLSFTPLAAAGAWLGALLLRGRNASVTAALAGVALTAAVAPRAVARRQPDAGGQVLRVVTVNLLVGRAAAGSVVGLVRDTDADVLFLQELTEEAVTRLKSAGLNSLLPFSATDLERHNSRGNGIYARYPLSKDRTITSASGAFFVAWLEFPPGSVQLACVHLRAPSPPWSRHAVARWRGELIMLPPPSGRPVILGGDFNSTIDHAQFRQLLQLGYVDAVSQTGHGLVPTWGPGAGRRALLTIDHILLDPRCAVLATSVRTLPGSDHRAVCAELRLPAAGIGWDSL